jgi:hypothetical protein
MESPGIRDFGVRRHFSLYEPANDVDHLAVEEPLEIILRFHRRATLVRKAISITMRTPGQAMNPMVPSLRNCKNL